MRDEATLAFLPERLNGEPVVYRGLTSVELASVAGLAIGVWLPVCLLICGALGYLMLGFGLAAALALGTVWRVSGRLQALKRGKPPGYHILRAQLWLEDRGLRSSGFIRTTGHWSTRRTR